MMTKTSAKELRLRSDIAEALRIEQRRIDSEIKELRRRRREIGLIVRRAKVVSRKAYRLMETQTEKAEKRFNEVAGEGQSLARRVLDLRGYCDLYSELHSRHIDMWVTLKAD
jgi:hypothetical protein